MIPIVTHVYRHNVNVHMRACTCLCVCVFVYVCVLQTSQDVFLIASCHCPSAVTWRGVGIACFRVTLLLFVCIHVYTSINV